jgi:uncharacterized RDD family membrane protein YckC
LDWFYSRDGKQLGPVSELELTRLVDEDVVVADSLVWHAGMAEWLPYRVAGPGATAASAGPTRFCSSCGKSFPADDLAVFGSSAVCAGCKPAFVQGLRQGAYSTAGSTAMRYGGFWIRGVALMIDGIGFGAISVLISYLLYGSLVQQQPDLTRSIIQELASLAIGITYDVFFWSKYGATLGQMALGLKVITPDGNRISVGRGIGRYFALLLDSLTLGIGFFMAGWDSEKRALHDRIAGTRVIRTR